MELGLELFGLHGFKKVSLDEVVHRAGISKGAFYLFFSSKEIYFLSVLEHMEASLRARFLPVLSAPTLTPAERFRLFLSAMMDALESTPLLARLSSEDLGTLFASLPEEMVRSHIRGDVSFFAESFAGLLPSGSLPPEISEEALAGVMQLYFYAFVNRERIGAAETRAATDLLTRMLCRTLFGEEQL